MTDQATEPIRHRCRPLHYDAGRDTLVHHELALRAYYKPLPQPVYVIEPTDQPPRAVVVFIHGLCEHAYRFFPLARELSRRRIQTVLFHLHGHGAGPPDTADLHWLGAAYLQAATPEQLFDRLGAAGEIDPAALERIKRENLGRMKTLKMEDHLQQVRQVADQLTRGTPGSAEPDGVPLLLGGHSLGGLLAAAGADRLARSGPVRPAGVFLLSPALRPRGRGLERGLLEISWAARRHVLLRPVSWLLAAGSRLNPKVDTAWASRFISDQQVEQRLHAADPLTLRQVRLGYLNRIEARMARTQARAPHYPIDLCLFAGRDDPIVDTRGAERFGDEVRAHRPAAANPLVIYDGCFAHDLLRSSKREAVWQVLDAWLEDRLAASR